MSEHYSESEIEYALKSAQVEHRELSELLDLKEWFEKPEGCARIRRTQAHAIVNSLLAARAHEHPLPDTNVERELSDHRDALGNHAKLIDDLDTRVVDLANELNNLRDEVQVMKRP